MASAASPACSAIAEFNSDIELSMQKLCVAMGIVSGAWLVTSAKKADAQRLAQSLRRAQTSTKEARKARKVARAVAHGSSVDYAPGAF